MSQVVRMSFGANSDQTKKGMELCALLIQELYGELTSRIYTVLLKRGRLQIHDICKHTGLRSRQVRPALVVLIQQNLIFFFETRDGTYYETRESAAYAILRSGRMLSTVEIECGTVARDIMQNLFILGHGTVSEIQDACEQQKNLKNNLTNGHGIENGSNGNGDHNGSRYKQMDWAIDKLQQVGLIQPFNKQLLRSVTDASNEIENKLMKMMPYSEGLNSASLKREFKDDVRHGLYNIYRPEAKVWIPQGKKRRGSDTGSQVNGNGKRRRLSNGESEMFVNGNEPNDDAQGGGSLARNIHIQANYEKFDVLFRNDCLVQFALEKVGPVTTRVYEEFLRIVQDKVYRCHTDDRIDGEADIANIPVITTKQLLDVLDPNIDLSRGIARVESRKHIHPHYLEHMRRKKEKAQEAEARADAEAAAAAARGEGHGHAEEVVENGDDDEENHMNHDGDVTMNGNIPEVDSDEDNGDDPFGESPPTKRTKVTFADNTTKGVPVVNREKKLLQLQAHLTLLAADAAAFIYHVGDSDYGEWCINFEDVVKRLQDFEIDAVVLNTFGIGGHRLVQMMRKGGKLDEKLLPNAVLLNQRDIRTKLAEMQYAGVVEVQGIPRDAAHSVNRMIFLWYFDQERVCDVFIENIYKVMSRHYQRLEVEKERYKDIIALSQRSDIRDGTERLADNQLATLKEFHDIEDKLLGQITRCDGLVGVFRDY